MRLFSTGLFPIGLLLSDMHGFRTRHIEYEQLTWYFWAVWLWNNYLTLLKSPCSPVGWEMEKAGTRWNETVTTKYSLRISAHCKPMKSGYGGLCSWSCVCMCVHICVLMHTYNIKRKQNHESQAGWHTSVTHHSGCYHRRTLSLNQAWVMWWYSVK